MLPNQVVLACWVTFFQQAKQLGAQPGVHRVPLADPVMAREAVPQRQQSSQGKTGLVFVFAKQEALAAAA